MMVRIGSFSDTEGCESCVRFLAYGFLGLLAFVTLEVGINVNEGMLLIVVSLKISANLVLNEFLSR